MRPTGQSGEGTSRPGTASAVRARYPVRPVPPPPGGRTDEIGQLGALQPRPQALDRVELGRISRQALHHQPVPLGRQPGPHRPAAVRRQPVPQQRGLLPTQEATQLGQDLDQGVGVVVAGLEVEGELGAAAADAVAQRGRHRRLLPVEPVLEHRRVADRRPGAAHVRGQAERGLVEEDQAGSASLGVCRIRGHRSLTQRSMAAWSRSAARRTGRWTLQPSRWRSSAHTQAGW